ncbi:MAG: DNA-3-methyladenine glycosylase 2 family protein [Bacteroidetes bacterium]|jgi:3-methyladenine DNA glycosylase/8-oxoguanine DNA glycosylase|nr:DNA-3-methyladenine glycosylase 2 family protein [Bacteroidota bacterium]
MPTPDVLPPPYDVDAAVTVLSERDPALGRVIDRVGPCTLTLRDGTPFQALLRSIVYQQLAGAAAATIYGRVQALFDGPPTPHALLALDDEALRGAGLSRNKTKAANDLAAKALDGAVPDRAALDAMANEAIIDRLTAVWGIGPWTVEMLLIFYLGRPDVLPTTDLGIRKGVMRTYEFADLPPAAVVSAHGEPWRPYRSVASWYLWRAADLE